MDFKALALIALTLPQIAFASQVEKTPTDYLAAGWSRGYYVPFTQRLADIKRVPPTSVDQAKCDDFYAHVRRTGEMKIILGVGYYDFSEGEPFLFSYRPDGSLSTVDYNFGMNATLDQTFVKIYRGLLTQKCHGALQFCGFEERSPGVFMKDIRSPEGARIHAQVELRSPSLSTSHAQNVGPLKAEQDAHSAEVTKWFFGSIDGADMVVYNGHARKGGGPDFSPPRLLSNSHVNYDWYGRKTPGLNNLTSALSAAQSKPAAVLLMACNSVLLFEKQVAAASPKSAFAGITLVPKSGTVPVKGTISGIDSYLKMQCQSGVTQEMSIDDDMRAELKPLVIK
jgi:hypothetical protein